MLVIRGESRWDQDSEPWKAVVSGGGGPAGLLLQVPSEVVLPPSSGQCGL